MNDLEENKTSSKVLCCIWMRGMNRAMKNLRQCRQYPGRDLNGTPMDYNCRVIPPHHLVRCFTYSYDSHV